MALDKYNIYRNYYKILNKTIIRNKIFHFVFTVLDTVILTIKILDIYHTNYSSNPNKSLNYLKPVNYFSNYSTIIKLIPILIYLVLEYTFSIVYTMIRDYKNCNRKFDIAFVNIFEFFFNRFLFIFYCEFLFSLDSLYFLLFLFLSTPFIIFIIIDMSIFHLTGFMLKIINFPFDDFTSLCDRQKLIIKILISICSVTNSLDISKMMFIIQFCLTLLFLICNTYIIFYKSYFMMNNELFSKTRYSNLLTFSLIQILFLFLNKEEIFEKCYIILYICMLIFITILIFLFYNPYNYIIIDTAENRVNLFYYFFLIDREKNPTFYLEKKIKNHIFKCGKCSLCINYQKYILNHDIVDSNFKNKEKDLFEILYSGNDKSMILFNHIINDIRNLGFNCVYKNSYYIINLIYIFYYSLEKDNINFSLNLLLIFNLIQENNHALILNHRISIKQIIYINEFFILYKNILSIIKEIISKNRIKRYIKEFFDLSRMLALLNNSKFKEYLYDSKNEGVTNYAYIINICSFLYEEIFNKTISSYAIPIRENFQLHEDILKNYYKQNNHIILNFNLRTNECRIIFAGNDLYYYVNNSFYDLFPNIMKEVQIYDFSNNILNYKENSHFNKTLLKSPKTLKKQYTESNLIIKHDYEHIYYYWKINLRLTLLFNDHIKEAVLFNGIYFIDKNIVMTFTNKLGRETICGYGNKNIMEFAYKNKLNFNRFKECDFMLNKTANYIYSISVNNNNFNIYTIKEKKSSQKFQKLKTNKKNSINEDISKLNKESSMINMNDKNGLTNSEKGSNTEDNSQSEISNLNSHNEKIKNIIEDTASLSSNLTKSNVSSFWKLSKGISKDKENSFSSKKFLKLQMILGLLLLALLILIIILILRLNILKNAISSYSENYYNLRQFIRTFHQFSYSFLTVTCIVKSLDNSNECEEYLTELHKNDIDKIYFIKEQNKIISELCSDSIVKIILNSETVQDHKLIDLLKGNFLYQIMNIKGINGYYEMNYTYLNISLSNALLLLSNNMRRIVSEESKIKTRDKEPIYLIYSYKDPFHNLNKTEELSDYQTAVYSFILNYKSFVLRFASLNERLYELITNKNKSISSLVNIIHNIIFIIMIFQLVTILFYLFIYNTILTKIINSIILKFDITFDEEDDFRKLFLIKINKLESVANIYSSNPINSINDVNKNCSKYKNLLNIHKRNKQKFSNNKKNEEEENEIMLFKDNQKFINWMDIYEKGYDRFYLILVIIVTLIGILVYIAIFGLWIDYRKKSETIIELIYYTWNFERNTLRLVNFYHNMVFLNRTIEDITNDYFNGDNYTCIENLNKILFSYYEIRKKRKKVSNLYKDFTDFCEYNCKALYNFLLQDKSGNNFYRTINNIEQTYGEDIQKMKELFIEECESNQTFLGKSISQIFQSIYQKMMDFMILFKDRSYEGIINKIFNSSLPKISSMFLNVIKYIIYIIGKMTYTDASQRIINILETYIIITLVLYIISECILFIIFFFFYIRNIDIECKNMFTLKSVFEITNLKE